MSFFTKQKYIALLRAEEDEDYQLILGISVNPTYLQKVKKELMDASDEVDVKIFKIKEVK